MTAPVSRRPRQYMQYHESKYSLTDIHESISDTNYMKYIVDIAMDHVVKRPRVYSQNDKILDNHGIVAADPCLHLHRLILSLNPRVLNAARLIDRWSVYRDGMCFLLMCHTRHTVHSVRHPVMDVEEMRLGPPTMLSLFGALISSNPVPVVVSLDFPGV